MKTRSTCVAWLALLMVSAASWTDAAEIDVYFSPGGGVARAIAAEIDDAKTSVSIMSFTISEPQICAALKRANQRGLSVRLIVNKTQETSPWSRATSLFESGIDTRTDDRHTRMHNKVVIIDTMVVCTGSANHSKSADRSNAENLLVVRDKEIAAKYTDNFLLHWAHSRAFRPIERATKAPAASQEPCIPTPQNENKNPEHPPLFSQHRPRLKGLCHG